MKKEHKWIPAIFVILVMIVSLSACDSIANEQLETDRLLEQDYSFDPVTILDSLANGQAGEFVPLQSTPTPASINSTDTVRWQQSDYAKIASAIYKHVWGNTGEEQYLWLIGFHMECAEVDIGPQWAFFRYVKFITVQEKRIRLERHIYIEPQEHLISVSEVESTPAGSEGEYFDLGELKITLEQAIQIAEANGGMQKRNERQNECSISSRYSPNSLRPGWTVDYYNLEGLEIISFQINPETGKFKVSH